MSSRRSCHQRVLTFKLVRLRVLVGDVLDVFKKSLKKVPPLSLVACRLFFKKTPRFIRECGKRRRKHLREVRWMTASFLAPPFAPRGRRGQALGPSHPGRGEGEGGEAKERERVRKMNVVEKGEQESRKWQGGVPFSFFFFFSVLENRPRASSLARDGGLRAQRRGVRRGGHARTSSEPMICIKGVFFLWFRPSGTSTRRAMETCAWFFYFFLPLASSPAVDFPSFSARLSPFFFTSST